MWQIKHSNSINFKLKSACYSNSFDRAKADFRTMVKEVIGRKGVRLYLKMIDTYCKEVYPKRQVPQAFKDLKVFLSKYITDPKYFPDPETFTFDMFEDENLQFGWNGITKHFYISVKNKDKGKSFPVGRLPILITDDPKQEFCFDIRDGYIPISSGKVCRTTVYLTYEKSDENLEFDEDEDEDDDYDNDYDEEDDDEDEYEEEHETPRSYSNRSSYSSRPFRSAPVPPPQKKPLAAWERAELHSARNHYEKMANESARYKNTPNAYLHEAAEKRAFAELMRIEAKYAGRE